MAGAGSIALSLGLGLITVPMAAPPAASAAARPAPKVSLTTSHRTVSSGSKIKLTTKVLNPKTGKPATSGSVSLQLQGSTAWKTALTRSVTRSGTYTFSATPKNNTRYRILFQGGSGLRPGSSPAVTVAVRPTGAKVVAEAARHKGALYKYGAAGPRRFDCSGFTLWVYKKTTGRKLPHKANSQQRYGRAVGKGSKRPGDLIIFRSGSYGYHAAVYAGNGYMWDSPRSGARVSKRKMFSSNYVVRRLV